MTTKKESGRKLVAKVDTYSETERDAIEAVLAESTEVRRLVRTLHDDRVEQAVRRAILVAVGAAVDEGLLRAVELAAERAEGLGNLDDVPAGE